MTAQPISISTRRPSPPDDLAELRGKIAAAPDKLAQADALHAEVKDDREEAFANALFALAAIAKIVATADALHSARVRQLGDKTVAVCRSIALDLEQIRQTERNRP